MNFMALFRPRASSAAQARQKLSHLLSDDPIGEPGTGTAHQAHERLQLLLSHDREAVGPSDLVALLREEILAVIAKHALVNRDQMRVKLERGASVSMLGVSMDLPISTVLCPTVQKAN